MFDTNLIAKRIKELRIGRNMTQMDLADEMGVSYQAVSNWERGNSMPDISKLEELANILKCSIDNLLGSSKETEVVKKIMNDDEVENEDISIQDMGKVMPILKPDQTHNILEDIILSDDNLDLNDIVPLAPFIDQGFLEKLLDKVDAVYNLQEVIGLAPFLSEETLDKVSAKIINVKGLDEIVGLAPFLSQNTLDNLVMKAIDGGNIDECCGLYPFLPHDTLLKVADIIVKKHGISALKSIAPFL